MTVVVETATGQALAEASARLWARAPPERLPAAWDRTLCREEQLQIAARVTLARASGDVALLAHRTGGACGVTVLRATPWDTTHFGLPMAELRPFLVTDDDPEAAAALGRATRAAAAELGYHHVRVAVRAGDHAALAGLQAAGFAVRWVSGEIVCDAAGRSAPRLPAPASVTDARPDDVEALLEIVDTLGPYNWPELDPALPPRARAAYVPTRLRSCVLGDFADLALVLRWRGRVVGFHAGATGDHGLVGSARYSFERDTFVAPDAPGGLGRLLLRAAIARHAQANVRFVRGRVRLEASAMLRASEGAGFRLDGCELLLTA